MMKQVAVIQCTKRSKALKRTIVRPERPLFDPHHAADQIERDQQEQACRGWRCAPIQRSVTWLKVPPVAAGRLDQHAFLRDPEW